MLKIQLKGCYRMEINSKPFSIPILTAILSTTVVWKKFDVKKFLPLVRHDEK